MGTTAKRPYQKRGGPQLRTRDAPYRLANSWKGLLRVHHDMQAVTGEDKRCGPHPRKKKVTLAHVSIQDEDPDTSDDSVRNAGVERRRADFTPRHYRAK